jgi:hypothetical protein
MSNATTPLARSNIRVISTTGDMSNGSGMPHVHASFFPTGLALLTTLGIWTCDLVVIDVSSEDPFKTDFFGVSANYRINTVPKPWFERINTWAFDSYNQDRTRKIDNHLAEDVSFIGELKQKDLENSLTAIDFLYDRIYPLMSSKVFARIDSIASLFLVKEFSLRPSIAFLTATNSLKENLMQRNGIIAYVKDRAAQEGLTSRQISSILSGL